MVSFAEQGAFAAETLVWRAGYENWMPWSFAEPELKNEFQAETIKQVIEEKIVPNISIAQAKYASFGSRLCAFAIDSVVIQLLFVMLSPLHAHFGVISEITPQTTMQELMPTMFFVFLMIFCYDSFFVKNFSGTPGKIALRLAVVRHNGKAMTWNCAFLRAFIGFFSTSLFGAGCLLAAFDIEKRALHDFIADTRVLRIGTVN
jgi:uncharacterized RDD family membrane protein YckC